MQTLSWTTQMDGFNLPEKLKHSLFCDIETRFCYKIMDVEKNIVFKTSKNALDVHYVLLLDFLYYAAGQMGIMRKHILSV